MPTYVYEAVNPDIACPSCREGLEVRHGINEEGPKECPRCGAELRRRLTAPNVSGRWSQKSVLTDANLRRHGFTKLINEGGGRFRIAP